MANQEGKIAEPGPASAASTIKTSNAPPPAADEDSDPDFDDLDGIPVNLPVC